MYIIEVSLGLWFSSINMDFNIQHDMLYNLMRRGEEGTTIRVTSDNL
jgi:hypothetical protein